MRVQWERRGSAGGDILVVKIYDAYHNIIYKKKVNILDKKSVAIILFDLQEKFNIDVVNLLEKAPELFIPEFIWQP